MLHFYQLHNFYQAHHFHVNTLVLHYIASWKPLAYGIIFVSMIFEGEIFLFTAAFLVAQRLLSPEFTFLAVFGGVLAGDSLWYWLGHKLNHSDNRFSRWLVKKTGQIDDHLSNNPLRTIFISKFIYGIHHLILVRAGVLKLKFKEFFKDDFIANLVWVFLIGGIGYLSGASFVLVRHYFKFVEYGLIFGLIIFFTLNYFIAKYELKKKI